MTASADEFVICSECSLPFSEGEKDGWCASCCRIYCIKCIGKVQAAIKKANSEYLIDAAGEDARRISVPGLPDQSLLHHYNPLVPAELELIKEYLTALDDDVDYREVKRCIACSDVERIHI